MEIYYKCRCQPLEQTLTVPDRRPEGDLMKWMEAVQVCIGMDHQACSPQCMTTEMEYAKIPMNETTGIVGQPVTKQ